MKETPRVPSNIFKDIKSSLTKFYPEYQEQIAEWKSLNQSSTESIQWIAYDTYQDLYTNMFDFLDQYDYRTCMILTFSSCITVRGSLGDLARIRQLIEKKRPQIPINSNYKNMDDKCLFLSTANSSKGLERNHVFVISTFPLEKAFINFSKDLTMNLITVAISRAKIKATVCVPKMVERYSTAFYSYPSSPKPTYTFFPGDEMVTIPDYLNMEHSVTDILRQNVIKYDTRLHFQSFIKKVLKRSCMPPNIFHNTPLPKIILKNEEERAFVGVCLEVLMTTEWKRSFPKTPSITEIEFNPMYTHCIRQIKDMRVRYHRLKKSSGMTQNFFACIFLYTELFMAIHHKIFFHFNEDKKRVLGSYWTSVRPYVSTICPQNLSHFEVQKNIKMLNITGIMDGFMVMNDKKHIFEIKASIKPDWKEDAFIQAFIYAIQMGQSWFHLHLMNLFKNEYYEYIIYIDSGVKHARNRLLHDVVIWNMNSFLAKCPTHYKNLEGFFFIYFSYIDEVFIMLSMASPTRICIEFQAENIQDIITFLAEYEHDPFKKYILIDDASPTNREAWILDFPFFILPPTDSLESFFPDILQNTDNLADIIHKQSVNLDQESTTQYCLPLDNPMIRMVYMMVTIITVNTDPV
jgi:hypothetical protein